MNPIDKGNDVTANPNEPPFQSSMLVLPPKIEKTLAGDFYNLVPFKEDHIQERYLGWLNDPQVNQFLEVRLTYQTCQAAAKFVRSFYGDKEKYMWGIYPKESDEYIGTATLNDIDRYHGVGEIGLLIGEKKYWGKGVSEEVVCLLAQFGFRTLKLRKLVGGTYALNHGMNFTYRRLGFTCEGKLRQQFCLTPGTYTDGYRWGMLADDWLVKDHENL